MVVRFQVDPDFYDHPKSIGMSDAATALWVRAGSYSAAKLLDGFIAEHVLSTLSRQPEEAAAELVARGLWRRTRGGYQFHQWDHRNLTKAQIENEREADRERKRSKRLASKSGGIPAGHPPESEQSPNGFRSVRVGVGVVSESGRAARRTGRRPPAPHAFVDDGTGTCASCSLLPENRAHARPAGDHTP